MQKWFGTYILGWLIIVAVLLGPLHACAHDFIPGDVEVNLCEKSAGGGDDTGVHAEDGGNDDCADPEDCADEGEHHFPSHLSPCTLVKQTFPTTSRFPIGEAYVSIFIPPKISLVAVHLPFDLQLKEREYVQIRKSLEQSG